MQMHRDSPIQPSPAPLWVHQLGDLTVDSSDQPSRLSQLGQCGFPAFFLWLNHYLNYTQHLLVAQLELAVVVNMWKHSFSVPRPTDLSIWVLPSNRTPFLERLVRHFQ